MLFVAGLTVFHVIMEVIFHQGTKFGLFDPILTPLFAVMVVSMLLMILVVMYNKKIPIFGNCRTDLLMWISIYPFFILISVLIIILSATNGFNAEYLMKLDLICNIIFTISAQLALIGIPIWRTIQQIKSSRRAQPETLFEKASMLESILAIPTECDQLRHFAALENRTGYVLFLQEMIRLQKESTIRTARKANSMTLTKKSISYGVLDLKKCKTSSLKYILEEDIRSSQFQRNQNDSQISGINIPKAVENSRTLSMFESDKSIHSPQSPGIAQVDSVFDGNNIADNRSRVNDRFHSNKNVDIKGGRLRSTNSHTTSQFFSQFSVQSRSQISIPIEKVTSLSVSTIHASKKTHLDLQNIPIGQALSKQNIFNESDSIMATEKPAYIDWRQQSQVNFEDSVPTHLVEAYLQVYSLFVAVGSPLELQTQTETKRRISEIVERELNTTKLLPINLYDELIGEVLKDIILVFERFSKVN
ncbi:hypothetical protein HK098_005773 [Nowakowskiella sp. JEL0407]|nr:hypothetical protein HK098_005773 [Nowakowskiella sp. JEL0407]